MWVEPMVKLLCSRRGNYDMYIVSVTPYTKPHLWVKKIKDATHNYMRMAKKPLCKVYFKEHVNFKQDDCTQ